ncbi:MAG: prepilin-type N-terminal cleavage/methylation domain [Marinobacter excellens HL-55]|uniref:Prepilin-type N-terminal cleavage/methylation domain n=1 Tax=Marinobacter excellens HL-55 TaxID=1305731 RepID=A0A0P8B356_9GAMM|nr:MAG: prepilin-type N-terminal cleavage/methylation domain [Marinobacter excellens HL-55]
MAKQFAAKASGFTLVELVMVIILIGVLSALGVGLFSRSSAFSPILATQQLASATLLAQQAALAGNPSNSVVIRQTPNAFEFEAAGSLFSIRREGASLAYQVANQSGPTSIPNGGLSINFDSMGRLAVPFNGQSLQFQMSGDSDFTLCLSSLGAVYQGPCS